MGRVLLVPAPFFVSHRLKARPGLGLVGNISSMGGFHSLRMLMALGWGIGMATLSQGDIDIACDPVEGNHIDWDCVLGPDSLEEVNARGGRMTTCGQRPYACSRFVVKKEEERSEVKVNEGPDGFDFNKGEKYIFKYSFKPREDMRVSKHYTHFGQLKGTIGKGKVKGEMIKLDPLFSLTANTDGIMVRFSNRDSTGDFHEGLKKHLDWDDALGQWVHVKIKTTFGESMTVYLSGAVEGKAVWPSSLQPVAWHKDADRVRMKLGLYHKANEVFDGMVEYKDIMIKGPNGKISAIRPTDPGGDIYLGCFEDDRNKRVFPNKLVDAHMTTTMCSDLCEGSKYYGLQFGNECWCGTSRDNPRKHGTSGNCNMDCAGNDRRTRKDKCGGFYAMDVYEHEGRVNYTPKGTTYLGCFADDTDDRTLTFKDTTRSNMDYDGCKEFCGAAKDVVYFGVQYGNECFCGTAKDDMDEFGPAICNFPCSGDSSQICGGFLAMNVFRM